MTEEYKHKILFIDEDKAQLRRFSRYVSNYPSFDLLAIDPPPEPQDVVSLLDEEKIDAVICDFDLREKQDVDYYGDEVIDEILKYRPHFPVFIFTSHEGDALARTSSVHYIYDKNLMGNNQNNFIFLDRVKQEIKNYSKLIDNLKEEFFFLKEKLRGKPLSIKEQERLIELDGFIERIAGGVGQSIPQHIKEDQNNKLNILISSTQKILAAIKSQNK
ncbi:MAG: hypothetical protein ACRBFS_14050 [Aureispira sp.]